MRETTRHPVLEAAQLGLRALLAQPGLAAVFLGVTLAEGFSQGLLVWALRGALRGFSDPGGIRDGALLSAAALIFGVWMLRSACTYFGEDLSARIAHRVEHQGAMQLMQKLLSLSVRFFDKRSQGDLALATYADLKGIRFVTMQISVIALQVSRLCGLAVVAWLISPKLTLVGIAMIPLGLLPAHWLGQRVTRAAARERDTHAGISEDFLQVSSGIRVIKVNRAEGRMLAQTERHMRELFAVLVKQVQARSLSRLLFEAVTGTGLVIVLVMGGRDVGAGRLEWQSLFSVLIAIIAVYSPVTGLLGSFNVINSVLPNLHRLQQVMDAPVEVPDRADARPLRATPDVIEFEHVSFQYEEQTVLRDVSARFRRGEKIGVVGPSGAGKSTFMSLLLRLYDPTSGRITLDGVDLRDLVHADLMDHCAIVLQEPFLFPDTIANNIRLAKVDASHDEIVAAAKAANIHTEIMQMERGYDTVIARRKDGRGISVGQKQRLCIAAALLKNAPILFLDEATSNLDSVSERAVQSAFERLMVGRTSFVIAHRLSTLRTVDRILVLDHGHAVGLGTHAELLRDCETYRRLWMAQMSAEPSRGDPPPTPAALRVTG
jgi:ATP-binding cassette, subfamily B, bacterial MsbA